MWPEGDIISKSSYCKTTNKCNVKFQLKLSLNQLNHIMLFFVLDQEGFAAQDDAGEFPQDSQVGEDY